MVIFPTHLIANPNPFSLLMDNIFLLGQILLQENDSFNINARSNHYLYILKKLYTKNYVWCTFATAYFCREMRATADEYRRKLINDHSYNVLCHMCGRHDNRNYWCSMCVQIIASHYHYKQRMTF